MKNKVYSPEEAVKLIHSGDTISTSGFGLTAFAEEIAVHLEKSYLETGEPSNLTLYYCSGQSNWRGGGIDHFAHKGMLKRIIGGHYGAALSIGEMVMGNEVEAYNVPQGAIVKMLRSRVEGQPGLLTRVGLGTYVDPRQEGGKMNSITTENISEVSEWNGEEYLFYPSPKIQVGIIRGTVADTNGNLTIDEEPLSSEIRLIAMAARASGGKVIAQVKHIAAPGSIAPNRVHVPGIFVDAVVECSDPERYHRQTTEVYYDQTLSGQTSALDSGREVLPLDIKKVIARRGAQELRHGAVVNLGLGIPAYISLVANEEDVGREIVLTLESGIIGGIPCKGVDFGVGRNYMGMIDQASQFDFYHGRGLDMAFLGFAQINAGGDVNVSKFSGKVAGCGGFIDISQCTDKVVYCGTFTAGGLETELGKGGIRIIKEGKHKKFVKRVDQITFNGQLGLKDGQDVMIVTERAVFRVKEGGLVLTEIAPGIDLERDILNQMEFSPRISSNLKEMDCSLFLEPPMGLKQLWRRGELRG